MSGKHAVVIGGSKGIGAEIARQGLAAGWAVTVVSRSKPAIAGVAHIAADVEDLARSLAACREAANEGLDALILCQRYRGAGDAWAGELAVTLSATKALVEGLAPALRDGGAIVALGSLTDRLVADDQGPGYHAAKAALRQLIRYYAATLAPRLRVNTVTPGVVLKDEAREYWDKNAALRELLEKATPLRRLCRPADVAAAVWFLCSPQAAFVTGHDLVVDGGLSLSYQPALARKVARP